MTNKLKWILVRGNTCLLYLRSTQNVSDDAASNEMRLLDAITSNFYFHTKFCFGLSYSFLYLSSVLNTISASHFSPAYMAEYFHEILFIWSDYPLSLLRVLLKRFEGSDLLQSKMIMLSFWVYWAVYIYHNCFIMKVVVAVDDRKVNHRNFRSPYKTHLAQS